MWVTRLANVADSGYVMDMHTKTQQEFQTALEAQGFEVLGGKGGFWLRGHGHVTIAQARRMTGIAAEPRVRRPRAPTATTRSSSPLSIERDAEP